MEIVVNVKRCKLIRYAKFVITTKLSLLVEDIGSLYKLVLSYTCFNGTMKYYSSPSFNYNSIDL